MDLRSKFDDSILFDYLVTCLSATGDFYSVFSDG